MEAGAELEQRREPPRCRTVPDVGRRMPATHFSSVVLPDPLWPINPNVEPSRTSSETSWSAQKSSERECDVSSRCLIDVGFSRKIRNRFERSRISSAGRPLQLLREVARAREEVPHVTRRRSSDQDRDRHEHGREPSQGHVEQDLDPPNTST